MKILKSYNQLFENKNNLDDTKLNKWIKDIIQILNDKFHNTSMMGKYMWNDEELPYYYIDMDKYSGILKFKTIEALGRDKVLFTYSFKDSDKIYIQDFFDNIKEVKQKYLNKQKANKYKI